MKTKTGVMICIEKNNRFLFLKRSKHDTMPNLLEFPSGGVKKGETLEEAAKRELFEETGLKLGFNLYCRKTERYDRGVKTVIHFFFSLFNGGEIKLDKDHSEYRWLTKRDVLRMKPSEEISIDAANLFSKNFDTFRKVYKLIHQFVDFCKKNIDRKIAIMLVGSYARGEALPVWSDLDLVVFIRNNGKPIPIDILTKLRTGILKAQKNIKIPVWLKIHTERTFFDKLSLNNLINFYHEGKLIYGENIKNELKKFVEKINKRELKKLCKNTITKDAYWVRYFYTGINENNKEIGSIHIDRKKGAADKILAAQIIDKILEMAQYSLFLNGKLVINKKDVVAEFKREFKDFALKNVPSKMYEIRESWNNLNKNDIEFILIEGPRFSELFTYWLFEKRCK